MFGLYRGRPSRVKTYIVVQDGKVGCGGVEAVGVGELEVEELVEVGESKAEELVEVGESVRKEPSVKPH